MSTSDLEIQVGSEREMDQLGSRIASRLQPGDVIGLTGDLGAGKTCLVKSMAIALGADPLEVNSPTFSLIQEYAGSVPLRHCDTYRLRDPAEFVELGLDELFAEDGIAFVEWADRVREQLPHEWLEIRILATSETSRQVRLTGVGRRGRTLVDQIRQTLASSR